MTKRERLYPEIKRLREEEGLTWREIGERLGVSLKVANEYYHDPRGERARERKLRNARQCLDCGKTVNTDGRTTNVTERCVKCTGERRKAQSRKWILDSFREWDELFGAPPSAADWDPSTAIRSRYCAWKAERLASTGRRWPCSSLVTLNFGSWNDGLTAAGFTPLKPSEHPIGHAGIALRRDGERLAA